MFSMLSESGQAASRAGACPHMHGIRHKLMSLAGLTLACTS